MSTNFDRGGPYPLHVHYTEAERLLEDANDLVERLRQASDVILGASTTPTSSLRYAHLLDSLNTMLTAAQIHATLATADPAVPSAAISWQLRQMAAAGDDE